MGVEVPKNEEISEGKMQGEKESVLSSVGEEQIGVGINIKESEEELLREMLIPT